MQKSTIILIVAGLITILLLFIIQSQDDVTKFKPIEQAQEESQLKE